MSNKELIDTILDVQNVINDWDRTKRRWSESQTRQACVEPILRALGWKTSDPRECFPEWQYTNGKRVDYALFSFYVADDFAKGTAVPCIIIEVKPRDSGGDEPGGILTTDDLRQLQGYVDADRRMEEGLAVLTNGTRWHIHQLQGGPPLKNIDAVPVDILYDDPRDAADVLDEYMGRQIW